MRNKELPFHQNETLIQLLLQKGFKGQQPPDCYNLSFKEKPTRPQVIEYLMAMDVKNQKNDQIQKNKYDFVKTGEIMCCIATLSIDQNYKQVPKLIGEIISELRRAKYKWYCRPIATCEFFSGENGKYNPHIHIINKRDINNGVAPSVIKQALTKKFKNAKYQVYNVDARAIPITAGENYIMGCKKEIKLDNCKKDKDYRESNYLKEFYDLEFLD